jgi:multidrug resistance efflux pump
MSTHLWRVNWYYLFIGLMLVAMLYVSLHFFRGSRNTLVGIARSKDYRINSEKASLVKTIHVVPGQQVKSGDLLIELSSNELEIDIVKLSNRIEAMTSEQEQRGKLVESDIAYIRAQQGITTEELDASITQLESKIKLNRQLTDEFVSDARPSGDESNPLQLKIQSLKQQREKHLTAMDIKTKDVLKKNDTEQTELKNQISLLKQELSLLREEQTKLNKYAPTYGVVENVYVKEGEQVDAFSSLLSLNPVRPTTAIAYLVGKGKRLSVGSEVTVFSYNQHDNSVPGKVIGFGSVSALPDILQKSTAVQAFGQEVFIEISFENNFANGEKVLIR